MGQIKNQNSNGYDKELWRRMKLLWGAGWIPPWERLGNHFKPDSLYFNLNPFHSYRGGSSSIALPSSPGHTDVFDHSTKLPILCQNAAIFFKSDGAAKAMWRSDRVKNSERWKICVSWWNKSWESSFSYDGNALVISDLNLPIQAGWKVESESPRLKELLGY